MNELDPPADKRALKRQYREAGPVMGMYAIRNRATGRVRVRASMNLEGAMQRDLFELRLRSHRDKELLAEWIRWGAEHFSLDIVDTLKKHDDPSFDQRDELAALLVLWTEELRAGPPAMSVARAATPRPRQPARVPPAASLGAE